jgi:hypothetical protein
LQGQVALLSQPDLQAPTIEWEELIHILDEDWDASVKQLHSIGAFGLLRPGVDGDIAGLFTLTNAVCNAFISAIESEAKNAKLACERVNETDFKKILAL